MATKTILIDDITGEEGDDIQNVRVSVNGEAFTIDLSADSLSKLHDLITPYREAGRKATGASAATTSSKTGSVVQAPRDYDPATVRAWQKSKGYKESTARFPKDQLAEYKSERAAGKTK